MKKLLAYILWPALAGLVFAFTLLQAPRFVDVMPGLAAYFPQTPTRATATPAFTSFSEAIRQSAPAVVSINYKETAGRVLDRYRTPEGEDIAEAVQDDSNSLGSGVIIRPDGYIITSYHVVFSNTVDRVFWDKELIVTLQNNRDVEARVVSLDEKNDLALLKIDAEQLPSLTLADTSRLQVGDVVLAIGNPRNIGQSVTFGIISALQRRDDSFMIQTDAAINPGNSGGALVNIDGNLIGINSTIVSESGGSEGIGFSIPADRALDLLEEYLASGPSGYLGVTTAIFELQQGQQLFGQNVQGFVVNEVSTNSPADKAGIMVGDIITGVGDKKLEIRDPQDEAEAWAAISSISSLPPGELIKLEIFRDGSFFQLPAILGVGEPQVYEAPVKELEDSASELPPRSSLN